MLLIVPLLQEVMSFKYKDGKISSSNKYDKKAHIVLSWKDKNSTAGFYELLVNTSKDNLQKDGITDQQQAYLAGYAEGYKTAKLISMYYRNQVTDMAQAEVDGKKDFNPFYYEFADKQLDYISNMINNTKNDQNISWWWRGVDLIVNQWLNGLVDGHNNGDPDFKLNKTQIYLLNSQGDMDDLEYCVDKAKMFERIRAGIYHRCTGALRITDDRKDVYFSQNTWTDFHAGFLRIAKHYVFHFAANTSEQNVKFSSYPGLFFSLDDFYMVHNTKDGKETSLAVLETTFHTFNTSLYDENNLCEGKSVLMWPRVQLANMLAFDAADWNKVFQYNHSWTYNNGYVLVDYGKLEEILNQTNNITEIDKQIIQKSVFNTLEVVPGHPKFFDISEITLSQGFYIQINTPEDDELFNISGYYDENEEDGSNYWSYQNGARKCMSDAILPYVNTLDDYKKYVRYNDYKNSKCSSDPGQGIASRYDLRTAEYSTRESKAFGCTDSKITNRQMMKDGQFLFYIGQTHGGDSDIPIFNFSEPVQIEKFGKSKPEGYHDVFPGVWELSDLVQTTGNVTAVVLSITIPCVIIVILLVTWTIIFYKRGGYNRSKPQTEQVPDEQNALLDDEGDNE